jgi:phosphate transport system protein
VRDSFHQQLSNMQQQIVRMGQLVIEAIENATLSLARKDSDLARRVIAGDDEVDRMQIEIQMKALQLMALQQPMARDLRAIATGLKLVTDLERMADHASDIAEITLKLEGEPLIKPLVDIPHMASLAESMTRDALTAYVNQDENFARTMIEKDHEVDHLYKTIFDELMEMMQQDSAVVRQATYLLQVAMYLERVGDHATNLGEWTIYMMTGEMEDLNQ